MRGLRVIALILSWLTPALGAAAPLAPAQDFAADARDMRARGTVMLILFSRAGCPWCERARNEVLFPLQNDPASHGRVVLREVVIDSGAPLTDFAGKRVSHRDFAAGERARVAPTLIVYGPDGARLADPIVGFRLADFYAEYVNRAIEQGLARQRRPSPGG